MSEHTKFSKIKKEERYSTLSLSKGIKIMTFNPLMRIVPSKPMFTNTKQMFILNFKLILDKIVSVLLNLDKNGFQAKLAPDLSQLVESKDDNSGPHEFDLSVIF